MSELSQILLYFTIAKVKSADDILQGLSKLDYLLKVSVFQVYKNTELEEAKNDIDCVF